MLEAVRNVPEGLQKLLETLRNLAQPSVGVREVYGRFRKLPETLSASFRNLPQTSRRLAEVCTRLRKVSRGFRKRSEAFLTASSTCEAPLRGARTEVKGTDGSRRGHRRARQGRGAKAALRCLGVCGRAGRPGLRRLLRALRTRGPDGDGVGSTGGEGMLVPAPFSRGTTPSPWRRVPGWGCCASPPYVTFVFRKGCACG